MNQTFYYVRGEFSVTIFYVSNSDEIFFDIYHIHIGEFHKHRRITLDFLSSHGFIDRKLYTIDEILSITGIRAAKFGDFI